MAMTLFDRVLVPIADPDDAVRTAAALQALGDAPEEVIVGHVIEKSDGGPDVASVSQRQEAAAEAFDTFHESFAPTDRSAMRSVTLYGTDVTETIVEAAIDADASVITFVPRSGGRLIKLISGDMTNKLVENGSVPVLAMPPAED